MNKRRFAAELLLTALGVFCALAYTEFHNADWLGLAWMFLAAATVLTIRDWGD